MNNISDSTISQFYDNLFQEQSLIMVEIKNERNVDKDKINHQQLELIAMLMKNLLKLKTIRKNNGK